MANSNIAPNTRVKFGAQDSILNEPDLLGIQVSSMKNFLQENTLAEKRTNSGLEQVFRNTFPIEDNHKNYILSKLWIVLDK